MSNIRLRSHSMIPSPKGSAAPGGRKDSSSARRERTTRQRQQHRATTDEYWAQWNATAPSDDPGVSGEDSATDSSRNSIGGDPVYPLHIQYQSDVTYDNMGKIRTGKRLRAEKTRLEDYHVTYRTPLHVPDNAYRAYLQGRTGRTRKDRPLLTKMCCLNTCVGFSVVAVIFLCFVGFLIDSQPLLITGTIEPMQVKASDGSGKITHRYILPAPGEVQPAARAAYRAAFAYFICILLSVHAMNPAWLQSQLYRFRYSYQDIPDHASSADSTLPQFHNPNGHDALTPPGFAQTIWNRCSYVIRQRLAEMGYFRPNARRKNDRKTG